MSDLRQVLLMRHAKSAWGDPSLADFDRPLAPRGLGAAPRMGRALVRLGLAPDAVLASPARRTRQTAERVIRAMGLPLEIQIEESFYGGRPGDVFWALRSLPDAIRCPLLIGHNPTWEEAVAALTAGSGGGGVRMPTAALARIDLAGADWGELRPGAGVLRWLLTPKLVAALEG